MQVYISSAYVMTFFLSDGCNRSLNITELLEDIFTYQSCTCDECPVYVTTLVFEPYMHVNIKLAVYHALFLAFYSANTQGRPQEINNFKHLNIDIKPATCRFFKGEWSRRLSQRMSNSRESTCSSSILHPEPQIGLRHTVYRALYVKKNI